MISNSQSATLFNSIHRSVPDSLLRIAVIAALLVIANLSGCGGAEDRKAKYLARGQTYLDQKNYDKARVEFKNVVQIDPKDAIGNFKLGLVEEGLQNYRKAFAYYSKSLELDPNLLEAQLKLVKIYALFDLPKAKELNQAALLKDPENTEGQINKALILAKEEKFDEAIAELRKIVAANPNNLNAAFSLAKSLEVIDRTEEQEQVLLKAAQDNPGEASTHSMLAAMYYNRKDFPKAIQQTNEIIRIAPDEANHYFALASLYIAQNDLEKAEQVLRNSISRKPDDPKRHMQLAKLLVKQNKSDQAISHLESVIEQYPELSELSFSLVQLHAANNENDKAEKILNDLIEEYGIKPAGLQARSRLAVLYLAKQQEEEAIKLLDQVLEENPKDSVALQLKGRIALKNKQGDEAISLFRQVLQDQPENVELHSLLASGFLLVNKMNLARDHLEKAVAYAPGNTKLRLQLATLLVRDKDFKGAMEHINAVLKNSPNDLLALQAKTSLLSIMGDREGVHTILQEIQDTHPEESAGVQFRLGHLYLSEKKYDKAIIEFNKALEKHPDSPRALAGLVDALIANGQSEKAIDKIQHTISQNPNNVIAHAILGQVYLGLKKYSEAISNFEKALELRPEYRHAMSSLMAAYEVQNQRDEAENYLQNLLKNDPKHPLANTYMAIIRISKQDYDAAEQYLNRAIEINPSWGQNYGLLASLYSFQKNWEKSINTYLDGIKADPKDIRIRMNLAQIYQEQNQMENALKIYEKVLEINPQNILARNNLSAILSDFRQDRQSLEKALELALVFKDSDQPMLLDTLGWIYLKLGQVDNALPLLQKATEKLPDQPILQYHLGMAYYKKGDNDKAKVHLTEAMKPGKPFQGSDNAQMILETL